MACGWVITVNTARSAFGRLDQPTVLQTVTPGVEQPAMTCGDVCSQLADYTPSHVSPKAARLGLQSCDAGRLTVAPDFGCWCPHALVAVRDRWCTSVLCASPGD